MDTEPSIPAPLPVIGIIRDAFRFVWDRKSRMVRALLIPAGAIFILRYFPNLTDWGWGSWGSSEPLFGKQLILGWLYLLVHAIPGLLFAITCHRLVLIGNWGVPEYGLLKWTKRESQYLGWFLVLLIVWIFSYVVIDLSISSKIISDVDAGASLEFAESKQPLTPLTYLPALYIVSRLSLLYPATAVDKQVNVSWAWNLSINNGWRLTAIVGIFPWFSYYLVVFLYRENATFAEYAILYLLGMILLAVEIVALSLSYKHLTENQVV